MITRSGREKSRRRISKRHRGDDDQSDRFGHLQKSLNLPGDNSVYRKRRSAPTLWSAS
jgi:hypothetical protein